MTAHKRTFDWGAFQGSPEALKWNQRDLTSIDRVLEVVPGRTACVQAGGNLGVFPKYLSQFFQAVLTFEPSPALFPMLTANVPETNVIRMQAALGENPGLVGMQCIRRGNKPGIAHEGLTHVSGEGIVPTLRLDALALPILDLLYLDLEGYELFALRGSAKTIERCRPVISVEVNQNSGFYGISREDIRDFITGLGYRQLFRVQSDEVFAPC